MFTKQNILYSWTFMRVVKLVMGAYVAYEAIANQQYVLLLLAAFFLYQGVFNLGHCGINGCSVDNSRSKR